MKRYLTYLAEDAQKKNTSLDFFEVDYFRHSSDRLIIRLHRNSKPSTEFDLLVEDLLHFSRISNLMELMIFSRNGYYRVVTISYRFR